MREKSDRQETDSAQRVLYRILNVNIKLKNRIFILSEKKIRSIFYGSTGDHTPREIPAARCILTWLPCFPRLPVLKGTVASEVPSALQHPGSVRDSHPIPMRHSDFDSVFLCFVKAKQLLIYALVYQQMLQKSIAGSTIQRAKCSAR